VAEQTRLREKKQLDYTFPFLLTDTPHYDGFPPHWHDCLEILCVQHGKTYASIDGIMHEIQAGDIALVNSGAVHGFVGSVPGTSVRVIQLGMTFFDPSFITLRDKIFSRVVIRRKPLEETEEGRNVYATVQSLFDRMALEFGKRADGWQLAVKSAICEFMLICLRNDALFSELEGESAPRHAAGNADAGGISPAAYGTYAPQPVVRQIQSFILNNFDDPDITLEDAAERAHLSKFYFTRFFKKHIGQSFHSYLSMTRINFAKQYLADSDTPVTDIAFRCGFGSLQTFNRLFKLYTGVTPSQYRLTTTPLDAAEPAIVRQYFLEKNHVKGQ
jgi:AraC-like DNA-binding protein